MITNVLAIRPEAAKFEFITEALAASMEDQGVIFVRVAEDLQTLSGPQSVALYNQLITPAQAPVKRFSDKTAAAQRLWVAFQDYKRRLDFEASEAKAQRVVEIDHDEDNSAPTEGRGGIPAPVATKARDRAKPANIADVPAPKAARRSTGINLAPKAKAYPCREGSKQAIMVDLLSRVQGATMAELLQALSGGEKPWQEVTVKSGLNWDMNKIKGYGIRTTKREEFDCYRLVLPKGLDKPLPHTPRKTAKKEG